MKNIFAGFSNFLEPDKVSSSLMINVGWDSHRFCLVDISESLINTSMDEDELFWDDNYNLISTIAMAIRQDLEKLEMRKGWMGFWDES